MTRAAILRLRLKYNYVKLLRLRDGYSCGRALASYINPGVGRQEQVVNALAARLAELDPEFKKIWEGRP